MASIATLAKRLAADTIFEMVQLEHGGLGDVWPAEPENVRQQGPNDVCRSQPRGVLSGTALSRGMWTSADSVAR